MYCRRSHWSLGVLFLAAVSSSSAAQTTSPARTSSAAQTTPAAQAKPAVWAEWNTLKPENEDFSILMPKDTSTEITKFEYHRFELNARLYLSAPTTGPVVGVASMSGIKSNPASNTDFERFNSYADAFKTFFPPKVRKDAAPKMILQAAKPFHGYTGRIYKLTVGDLTGTVNAYVTRKRFYAIVILNTKKDDALEDKFLSSFVIPDKPVEQPVAATEEAQEQDASAQSNNPAERPQRTDRRKPAVTSEGGAAVSVNNQEDNTELGSTTVQPNAQQNQAQQSGQKRPPISGGMLNGKAIYLPLPEMPAGEKNGVVMVQVLVDEQGMVVDARAVSGPPGLYASAVNAAKFARFSPTMLMGEPVRVQGTLAYNFARAN